ncbi:flavodoxin family protein [Tannockella kyphosi]|uniref:flavodoxin family protein n=1 Tax=Tannockella kyphosi TaxID=2899121 RepID=UPI0020120184|nr:flavodoxin family protein [Tannockella kyphosi]
MKVLLMNGSCNKNGCTNRALEEFSSVLHQNNIETEIYHIPSTPIKDCIGCGGCKAKANGCVFKDDGVNDFIEKAKGSDAIVLGSPVYYAHPSGRILSFLDRAFFAGGSAFMHKPGFALVSARRAGTSSSLDVLHKYFSIAQMPIVSSSYWNMVHGNTPQEVEQDLEGLQIIRHGASNMVWLLSCIELGKQNNIIAPNNKKTNKTNFIR